MGRPESDWRRGMKIFTVFVFFLAVVSVSPVTVALSGESAVFSNERFVQRLLEGNKRFAEGKPSHPNETLARREQVAKGQHPFAVVVSCSDSRVPPEIIFDQGIGDLFVVRVAGNIIDDAGLGSIEYAAEHLHVSLIVVLGHERCGAVEAAVKGGEAPGQIKSLVGAMRPAVEKARGEPGDLAENAMRTNVKMVVERLKASKPILEHLVHKGTLSVIGARYDLDDGEVTLTP
jgi:carbonic anhydrase